MAEIDGVLNSSAEAPGRGKTTVASQQLTKLTTFLFTAPLGPFAKSQERLSHDPENSVAVFRSYRA
ncbi:hypothetical protein [Bradyrhizobium ivorense]|uniref:hypothetical protein n=1 Tax=Bradyrhizobium ivorense TaxID=2511166 RepID=UPI001E49E500|nr:hypothetical protein [Bradyrhizobium ivorense]